MRLIISLIFLLSSCFLSATRDNSTFSLADTIREMCKGIPEGTYTLSITRAEFSTPDNDGREIRNQLDFSPETYIFLRQTIKSNDERLLDYYCLSDSSENRINSNGEIRPFETEQTISGRMEGGSKKLDGFNLKIMVPSIGEIYENHIEGRHFNICGLDFVDGTTFTLQALKSNDKEGGLKLIVDEPTFPNVSIGGYHYEQGRAGLTETASDYLKKKSRLADIMNSIALPDVVVRERRVRPMNFRGMDPDRAIEENDPIFETSPTLEFVLNKLGLRKGIGKVKFEEIDSHEYIMIEAFGQVRKGEFTPCEVMLDNRLLKEHELTNVTLLDPLNIKRIEYFLPSNYEMFGNLANGTYKNIYGEASKRGLLMIWLKSPTDFSYYRLYRPESLLTITPLGYVRPMEFSVRIDGSYSPTLYWDPDFTPDKYDSNTFNDIELPFTMALSIKIEGISNTGDLIYKQREIAHED